MATMAPSRAELGEFARRGYAIVPASDPAVLDALRGEVAGRARRLVADRGEPLERFFNGFADYGLEGAALNAFRLALVAELGQLDVARKLFAAFRSPLAALVGPDVAAQKTVNLVVQQPGDSDQVPVHRDAPSNSHFEVILWVPLVDVYGTKSMFLCDRERSAEGLALLQGGAPFAAFEAHVERHGVDLAIPYGSALLFAAGLAHGCKINAEPDTRWSLNLRYKNLFSPYGAKGLAEFFDVLELSPLSRVGFGFERQEFGL